MKKLLLDVEDLRVDQFAVESDSAARGRGTVVAQGARQAAALVTTWECPYTNGNQVSCYLGSCNSGSPCRKCPYA